MPRAPKSIKRQASRPQKKIDWNLVDELLEAGCLGTEICPYFDMHSHTFYDRVLQEKGVSFTDYSAQKRAKGYSIIRKAQFDKAVGRTKEGDTTLLMHLGKVVLGQKDSEDGATDPDVVQAFSTMMQNIAEMQKSMQNSSNEEKNPHTST